MAGWHHWCNGQELWQIQGDGEGQGSLACCGPWGCKVIHDWVTEQQLKLQVSACFSKLCWSVIMKQLHLKFSHIIFSINSCKFNSTCFIYKDKGEINYNLVALDFIQYFTNWMYTSTSTWTWETKIDSG